MFTGDVCFKEQHEMDAPLAEKVLEDMKPIFDKADLLVMNLETPLADEGVGAPIEKSGPAIIGRPANLGFLTAAGCDVAMLSNNHTGDYGPDALFSTLDLLDANNILHAGAGKNIREAYKAVRLKRDGVSISLIGVNENEFGIAGKSKPGTAGYDPERIADAILCEKDRSDYVIIVFHGGNERNPLPSPSCRARYRMLIRYGADAVIGGHTHCMQGYEYFDGKPIVYSMGNFFFKYAANATPSWCRGYVTELEIKDERLRVRPIPYEFAADGSFIRPLSGGELERTLMYIDKLSAYIPDTEKLSELFECWSVTYGICYPNGFADSDKLSENMSNAAFLKNNLVCEAHNEVCRTAYRVMFEKRLEEVLENKAELDSLIAVPVHFDDMKK